MDTFNILDAPAVLPRRGRKIDVAAIPDDAIIGIRVWAALQPNPRAGGKRGVEVGTVNRNRHASKVRRDAGVPRPGDMPPEDVVLGRAPGWRMGTYRAWEARRPGMGAGAGNRPGSTRPTLRRSFRVPFTVTVPADQVVVKGSWAQVTVTEEMARAAMVEQAEPAAGDSSRTVVP